MLPDTGIDDVKKQRNAEYTKHINDPVLSSLKMEGIRLLFSYNKYIHMHCSCSFRFLKYAVDFDSRPMIESNCGKFFTLRLLFGLNKV
jgi:hypothetical protein